MPQSGLCSSLWLHLFAVNWTELPTLKHVPEGTLASGPATESTSMQESSKPVSVSREGSCDWHLVSWACLQLGHLSPRSPQPVPAPGISVINLSQGVAFGSASTAVSRGSKWDIPTYEDSNYLLASSHNKRPGLITC